MNRKSKLILVILGLTCATGLTLRAAGPIQGEIVVDDGNIAQKMRHDFQEKINTLNPPSGILEETLISGDPEEVESLFQATSNTNELQPFPHMAMYGGPNSGGWPMTGTTAPGGTCSNNPSQSCTYDVDCNLATCNNPNRQNAAAALNQSVIQANAKFPLITMAPTPGSDIRPDLIPALKAVNPDMRIIAYVMAITTWCPYATSEHLNSYPPGSYFRNFWVAATGGDLSCDSQSNTLLWAQDGILAGNPPHNAGYNVNLAHRIQNPDSSYTYDVAENIATVIYNHAKPSTGFDGIFIDVFCSGILWTETSTFKIDYARAGYGNDNSIAQNRTDFDIGWQAGHLRLSQKLRELAIADGHSDLIISANCGQGPTSHASIFNGWMRENYPFQNGGTFYSNMLTYTWGYLHQDYLWRAPQTNYIFTATNPTTQPYSQLNQQKMRFGLGSASLGNGYHAFEDGSASSYVADYWNWWFDEYGVDVTVPRAHADFGKAKNGLSYTGWLGQPLGNFYQMINLDFSVFPDLITANQGFETAGATPNQIPNWSFVSFAPSVSTLTRDTSTAAVGSASAKVHIDVGNDVATYAISLRPSQTFSVTAYQQYSLSFWAKASTNRTVDIDLWNGGLVNVRQTMPITTEWRQYQVSIKPTISIGAATVTFDLGRNLGDVWIDDVHFQRGASNIFRRDFDRGIVLVNPTDTTQNVQLERPFKKINGTVNPTLNDGAVVSSVTLTPNLAQGIGDAAFLVDFDETVPAAVTDLTASSL